ncbi:MAG TPA: response regulator [Polyangia bacterium]|nr:response regulator [Polyangia bacterium]
MRNRRDLHTPFATPEPEPRAPRVLLAEDDAAMRDLLARTLRRHGFDVVEARSGYETLEWLAHGIIHEPPIWFDLVISDVRMPGYDGLNILASLRQMPVHVPVILITAFGSRETHAAAARLGAFAMLDKPFDVDDLMTIVLAATLPAGSAPRDA